MKHDYNRTYWYSCLQVLVQYNKRQHLLVLTLIILCPKLLYAPIVEFIDIEPQATVASNDAELSDWLLTLHTNVQEWTLVDYVQTQQPAFVIQTYKDLLLSDNDDRQKIIRRELLSDDIERALSVLVELLLSREIHIDIVLVYEFVRHCLLFHSATSDMFVIALRMSLFLLIWIELSTQVMQKMLKQKNGEYGNTLMQQALASIWFANEYRSEPVHSFKQIMADVFKHVDEKINDVCWSSLLCTSLYCTKIVGGRLDDMLHIPRSIVLQDHADIIFEKISYEQYKAYDFLVAGIPNSNQTIRAMLDVIIKKKKEVWMRHTSWRSFFNAITDQS